MKLFSIPIHSASLVTRTTTVLVMLNTLHQWWFCLGIYSFTLPALHITFTLLVSNSCVQQNLWGVCEIRIILRLIVMTTVSQLYACMIVHTYIVHLCMYTHTHICTHTNISIVCTYKCTRVCMGLTRTHCSCILWVGAGTSTVGDALATFCQVTLCPCTIHTVIPGWTTSSSKESRPGSFNCL